MCQYIGSVLRIDRVLLKMDTLTAPWSSHSKDRDNKISMYKTNVKFQELKSAVREIQHGKGAES